MRSIFSLIYVVLGVLVAQQNHYLAHLDSFSRVLSAGLAIAIWPAVLAGVNLHLSISTGR
jgi:hypothetical protein